jgi:seryl-tRNA synthetase
MHARVVAERKERTRYVFELEELHAQMREVQAERRRLDKQMTHARELVHDGHITAADAKDGLWALEEDKKRLRARFRSITTAQAHVQQKLTAYDRRIGERGGSPQHELPPPRPASPAPLSTEYDAQIEQLQMATAAAVRAAERSSRSVVPASIMIRVTVPPFASTTTSTENRSKTWQLARQHGPIAIPLATASSSASHVLATTEHARLHRTLPKRLLTTQLNYDDLHSRRVFVKRHEDGTWTPGHLVHSYGAGAERHWAWVAEKAQAKGHGLLASTYGTTWFMPR